MALAPPDEAIDPLSSAGLDVIPAQRSPIEAVCLDIDDTLVDHGVSVRAGLVEIVGHDGEWVSWSVLTDRHYARFTAGEIDYETMRFERTREFFAQRGVALTEREIHDLETRRMAAMRRAWRLFDDVSPCLQRLREDGLRLAAITNAAGYHQRDKLTAVGLIDAFDALVISGELGTAKPDPIIFLMACTTLGVHPGQAAHVGDRLDLDVRGARHAGLHGVWLNRTEGSGPPVQRTADGAPMICGLEALPDLVAWLHAAPWGSVLAPDPGC